MKRTLLLSTPAILATIAVAGIFAASAPDASRPRTKEFKDFKLITERNIFDPNRRPVYVRPPRTNAPPVYWFGLSGTMSYNKGVFAVFDGSSSEYHKVLETGNRIAVYTVTEINHDRVKLLSGTNTLELKVGMQMRRNTDGTWSTAAQFSGSAFTADSTRFRSSSRNDRFDRGGDRRMTGRTNFRNGGSFDRGGAAAFAPESFGGGGEIANPSADTGSSDPNDVVARMARRAAQERGVTQDQPDNAAPGDMAQPDNPPPGGDAPEPIPQEPPPGGANPPNDQGGPPPPPDATPDNNTPQP